MKPWVYLLVLIPFAVLADSFFQTAVPPGSFTTTFDDPPENPLSEGGAWVNNAPWDDVGKTGWKLPAKENGYAWGTHCDDQCNGNPCYNDAVVHRTGHTADHAIEGILYRTGSFSNNVEVELTCRASSSTNGDKKFYQYEFLIPQGNAWNMQLIRWNGDEGDWTQLQQYNISEDPADGDHFKLTCEGANPTTITAYWKDSQIMQYVDSGDGEGPDLETGNPGIGFYSRDSTCGPSYGENKQFGWKQVWGYNL